MNTLTEMFLHELKDMYYVEHKLVETLGALAEQSVEPSVERAFREHQEQTREHATRLEKVFESVNEKPSAERCPTVDGLVKEHDNFMKEDPTPQLLQLFDITAGIKIERYEISSYQSLIQMAKQLNRQDVVPYLDRNLQEEEEALHKLEGFSKSYDPIGAGHFK